MSALVHRSIFGEIKVGDYCETIYCYTLDNGVITVDIIAYGATITSIKLPDKSGKNTDVVLGFHNLQGYMSEYNPYFGGTIGRVSNVIANGQFKVRKKTYYVSTNNPPNTYNGGYHGLDKKIWDVDVEEGAILLSCISHHLEEGFPGTVEAKISYELTNENELRIVMRAKTTHATPINMTNHTYINLAGHESGWPGIRDHDLRINGDRYTPVNEFMIPTGEILPVKGTIFDIRNRRNIGYLINKSAINGFDCNYCVPGNGVRFFARALHRRSGKVVEVYSDQPGMQFYTGNLLSNIPGKGRALYNKFAGICFIPQNYPNAVNTPTFPNCILDPGEEFIHCLNYRFLLDQI